jgi:hypothetical protein
MNRYFSLLNLSLVDGVKLGITILVLGGGEAGGGGTGRTQKKQTRVGVGRSNREQAGMHTRTTTKDKALSTDVTHHSIISHLMPYNIRTSYNMRSNLTVLV